MEVVANNYLPGDQRLVEKIVYELKAQGIFDQFRKECFADVDTKPAYQNLRQRVEGSVSGFLKDQSWRPDMNKNQVREMLRKKITESGYLETGVERIVDQVVNPKINTVFLPKVEEVVYSYLGIKKPSKNEASKSDCDLLPNDLEAVSPESEPIDKKDEKSFEKQELDESKTEEDESPPFEPLDEQVVYVQHEENSIDSHLSGFSGLISHESNQSENKVSQMEQDSQMSRNSSDSRLSIVTSDENSKMDISCEDSQSKSIKSNDSNHKTDNKHKSSTERHKSRSESKDKDRKSSKDSKSRHSSSSKDKDKDKSRDRRDSKSSNSSNARNDKDKSRDSDKDKSRDNDKDKPRESDKDKSRDNDKDKPRESDKDKSRDNDKDKPRDSDKDKSRDNDKDKPRESDKDKPRDFEKDKSRDNDKEKSRDNDKDKLRDKDRNRSSSSSKHGSSNNKDKNGKKDSYKSDKDRSDKDKDKSRSSSHKDSKPKSSDSKLKDKSSSSDKHKHSSSHNDKHKKDKDRKKDSKSKDDHYSSKDKKNDRRSTDRDSNDGQSTKPNTSTSVIENNQSSQSHKSQDTNHGSGDSGNSEQVESTKAPIIVTGLENSEVTIRPPDTQRVKVLKPKCASNIQEAMKLMKIRKQLAKLEKQNQLSLASVDVSTPLILSSSIDLDDLKNKQENSNKSNTKKSVSDLEVVPSPLQNTVISQDNWDAMEAKLRQEVCAEFKEYDESYEEKAKTSDEDTEKCKYFDNVNTDKIEFLTFAARFIGQIEKKYKRTQQKRKSEDNDIKNNNKKKVAVPEKKRRITKKTQIIGNHTDISTNDKFSLPLSPAESEKSVEKKDEPAVVPLKPKRNSINKLSSQRYSSDDLYKPRPTFASSRRRGAKNLEN